MSVASIRTILLPSDLASGVLISIRLASVGLASIRLPSGLKSAICYHMCMKCEACFAFCMTYEVRPAFQGSSEQQVNTRKRMTHEVRPAIVPSPVSLYYVEANVFKPFFPIVNMSYLRIEVRDPHEWGIDYSKLVSALRQAATELGWEHKTEIKYETKCHLLPAPHEINVGTETKIRVSKKFYPLTSKRSYPLMTVSIYSPISPSFFRVNYGFPYGLSNKTQAKNYVAAVSKLLQKPGSDSGPSDKSGSPEPRSPADGPPLPPAKADLPPDPPKDPLDAVGVRVPNMPKKPLTGKVAVH